MPLPIVPIFIAGATTAIGWFFQNKSAKIATQQRIHESELKRAQEILREVSTSMDRLHFHMRHSAMHIAVRKAFDDKTSEEEDNENWDEFEKAMLNWMTNKTRLAAEVRQYFGDKNYQRMKVIQDSMEKAKSFLTSTYYKRKRSVVRDGKEDSGKYYQLIEPIEDALVVLSEKMIIEVQNENVGRLRRKK